LLVIRVAPLRRKTTGAFTPKTPWLHYAGNPVAPLRRKRNGSYMPEIHTQSAMSDFRLIRATSSYRKLYPSDTVRRHELSRAWLGNSLSEPFARRTVVVTHHAPSAGSVDLQYAGDSLTPAYASNLEDLMEPSLPLWIHGHMHTSFDYIVSPKRETSGTRVICNPRGYSPKHLNPYFNPSLIVEV
jgi:hypothetical protein